LALTAAADDRKTPTMSDGPQRARGFVRRWLDGPLWWLLPFLGFLLVFVVLLNSVIGEFFLDERIGEDVATLQTLTQEVDTATLAATTPSPADASILDNMRGQLSRLADSLNPAQLRTRLEAATDNILSVMSLFVLETLLLPLLFLYLFSKGLSALFDIDLRNLLDGHR
jgi:hypothetical protein